MTWLLQVAICNAVVILPLAGIVWLVARRVRSASLRRLLWLLVLVKLLAIPVIAIPLPHPLKAIARTFSTEMNADVSPASPAHVRQPIPQLQQWVQLKLAWQALRASVRRQLQGHWQTCSDLVASSAVPFSWIWLAGTAALGVHCWLRTRVFGRIVDALSLENAALTREVEELAQELGLTRCPRARLMRGNLSPLLYGVGRRCLILFPISLWQSQPKAGRRALLMHELVHYQRGDHWTRLLECCCLSLYWWHPLVWWIRGQVEVAEEESCDDAVRARIEPRVYAAALMDAIDLASQPMPSRLALVSGLMSYSQLHSRMVRILDRTQRREPGRLSRRLVLMCGLCLLPLQPTFTAQDQSLPLEQLFDDARPLMAQRMESGRGCRT